MRTSVRMHGTNIKGAVAEQAIALAAVKLGVPVLSPVAEHGRSDLALDIGGRLWRVQCKWGHLERDGGVVIANLSTSRHNSNGYVTTTYTQDEIDLFGVYCGDLDRCFLLPVSRFAGMRAVYLRVSPPRNNQRACINLADDFDFEGAVAQLGERRAGSAKVRGSSPLSSTPQTSGPILLGANRFRDHLGYWMDRVAAGEEVILTRHGKPRIRLSPAAEEPPRLPLQDARLAASIAAGGSSDASARTSSTARSATSAASAPPSESSPSASASST
jgi:prevent-host-death family protein